MQQVLSMQRARLYPPGGIRYGILIVWVGSWRVQTRVRQAQKLLQASWDSFYNILKYSGGYRGRGAAISACAADDIIFEYDTLYSYPMYYYDSYPRYYCDHACTTRSCSACAAAARPRSDTLRILIESKISIDWWLCLLRGLEIEASQSFWVEVFRSRFRARALHLALLTARASIRCMKCKEVGSKLCRYVSWYMADEMWWNMMMEAGVHVIGTRLIVPK